MTGADFPNMDNRKPEIYMSLHLNVKLADTDKIGETLAVIARHNN